jgi:hypothetical protein
VVALVPGPAAAPGQRSDVPYAADSDGPGPTYQSTRLNGVYPGSWPSLRKIDFANFTFLGFGENDRKSGRFRLSHGRFQSKYDFGYEEMSLLGVYYLPSAETAGAEYAVLVMSDFSVGGSSSSSASATVFMLAGGKLRTIQKIVWSTHGQGQSPIYQFHESDNRLVIRADHYIPGDAHCCISATDIVTYRWVGSYFVPGDIRTELSNYGKLERKTLPRTGIP